LNEERPLLKILVCDDDPADRKLVRAYLEQVDDREIVLLEAGQPEDIQNALDRGRIDLVLMDIQMPGKSGMEWLVEIAEKQTAPVVMLTGSGSEEIVVQALQEGAIGYLPKSSLSTEKLLKTIDAALEKWKRIEQSRANQEELERLANIDPLTGLNNRGALLRRLDEEIKHAERYGEDLALIMLDIDHFKKVNDNYGHLMGDDVLEKLATLMRQGIRAVDAVGRYGGEEFIIVLSKTNLSRAQDVSERIRKMIEVAEMKNFEGKVFHVTISLGIAGWEAGEEGNSLISHADKALYAAKGNGRNRVEVFSPDIEVRKSRSRVKLSTTTQ